MSCGNCSGKSLDYSNDSRDVKCERMWTILKSWYHQHFVTWQYVRGRWKNQDYTQVTQLDNHMDITLITYPRNMRRKVQLQAGKKNQFWTC